MKKRIFAFLMAVIMLVGSVPAEVLATTVEEDAGTGMYFIGDTLWLPEGEEPAAEVVETGEWAKTEETKAEGTLVCQEEHEHAEGCYQEVTLVKWEVMLKEDSYTTFDTNGLPVHFFVTTLEEAQDPRGSYQNYKKDLWGKRNGGSSDTVGAYAVTDILDLAPQIQSQQGIRAHIVEDDVIKYVAQWPNGGTADDFRKFTGSIRIDGTNYSGDEYEVQWVTICWRNDSYNWGDWRRCGCGANYDHIHIDGILTKKIQIVPGTMNLVKEIETAQAEDQTFNFKLYQLQLDSNYKPTSQTIGDGTPMTATVPAGSTTATIAPVDSNATFGFGYYMLVEEPSNVWMQSGTKIGSSANETVTPIYICINTDGTVQYSTQYNSGYKTASSATVVNKLIPSIQIKVSKSWADDNNRDGIRPNSVEVHLLKNSVHHGTPVTLNADNNWTATWTVPATDFYGNEIVYHVEEVVPEGYSNAVTGDAATGFVVTNTHASDRTSAQVQKVWDDDNNRDGVRPYGVKVQLYRNGEAVTSYTDANGNAVSGTAILTEADSWSHEWLGLVKNKTGAVGQANEYTAQEIGYVDRDGNAVTDPGYTESVEPDADTGVLLITNTYESATMDIPVEKVWADNGNRDGKRPASVTVTLTAGGEKTDKVLVLNEENDWKGIFEDLYVNANGTPIHYSVVENEVSGYTVKVTGSAADGFTVTNSHTPETTSIPVIKVWDDANDQDGLRPGSIKVQLYADGVAVEGKTLALDAAMDWKGGFDDLPKYRDGKVGELIVYTVKEIGHTDVDSEGNEEYTAGVPEGYTATESGTTVTNTHTPDVIRLDVEKVWDDENNYDGIRSHAVVVTLHINGEPAGNFLKENFGIDVTESLTLNEAGDWKGAWTGLPRFHNGQRISYSVVETGHYDLDEDGNQVYTAKVPEGYTVDHAYTGADTKTHTATVINIHDPVGTDLNVQKVWDDDDNRAGLRPGSIEVELYADGVATGKKLTLTAANEWDGTFTGLRVYNGDKKVVYTVVETALAESLGYGAPTYSDLDESLRLITVTNTRADEKVSVTVTKEWNDANNQDKVRPESVTVTLYANGIATSETRTLTGDNWTATFDNLYKHYGGKEVVYTVVETPVEGYTAEYNKTTDANGNVTIEVENIHTPEVISISVTKDWQDDADRDGIRPHSVVIELYADGVKLTDLELNEGNNWQGSFDNLPKYLANAQGQKITYTIKETGVRSEYQTEVTGSVEAGFTVTNTYDPAKTSVTVNKVWNDSDNQDRVRPSEITVYLYANGVLSQTAKLKAADGWTYTWNDLFVYEEGKEINYTVYEETLSNGYSGTITRTGNEITITNTRNVNKTTFTVQKIWDDANNQDDVRYDGVVVQLYADGAAFGNPVTLTADGHWLYTWEGLNVNKVGSENPVAYTVAELRYVTVDDQGNKTEVALDETYYTEGEPVLDSHTGITTITNKHTVEKTSITVKKNWDDAEDQDRIRPFSVTVELYQNGQPTGKTAVLKADTDPTKSWTAVFTDLDVHHGIGIDNVYTVVEIGHTMTEDGKAQDGVPKGYTANTGSADNDYTVTNTHEVAKVSIPVSKVWDDANDQDGKRPESITLTLQKKVNGNWEDVLDASDNPVILTLDASKNWQGVFADLDKNAAGIAIEYRVVETAIPGYNVVNGQAQAMIGEIVDGVVTITNVHEVEKTSVKVNKIWVDDENAAGVRPASITLYLYANGVQLTEKTATVSADSNDQWTYEWTGLDKYAEAKEINYTVYEAPVGNDYYATVARNGNEVTITNTRDTVKTTFTVQKIWDDANNQDDLRYEGVVVQLYADGAPQGETVTLTAEDHWRYTWTDLLHYRTGSGGEEVVYTVKEVSYVGRDADQNAVSVPLSEQYYEEPIDGWGTIDPDSGIAAITNTHEPLKTKVTVKKVWVDENDQDGIRANSITVQLYINGQPTPETAVLQPDDDPDKNWTAVFDGLDVHHGIGVDNVFTVVEIGYTDKEDNAKTGVPVGHAVTYPTATDTDGTLIINVTNTHEIEKVSIPVMKVWADANDQDGKRPAKVKVTLYADGAAVDTMELSAAENWRGSFDSMPKYKAGAVGQEIAYTVGEAAEDIPEGYTPTVDGNTITNTHTPEEVTVTATKFWNDANNQDGKRPASIKLHLLSNGVHMNDKDPTDKDYTIVLDGTVDANGETAPWVATWSNLPKNEEAKEINYTVYEETVGNGYSSSTTRTDNNITITNTRAVEKTSFTVQKVWNDANNQDNVRYDGVVVELLKRTDSDKDFDSTGKQYTLTADGHWLYTWSGLDKYENGELIEYAVKELNYVDYVQEDGGTKRVEVALDEEHYTEPEDGWGTLNRTTGITTITNTHTPIEMQVKVTKVWSDADNQDGKRPYAVRVELYRNGQPTGQTLELKDNNLTDAFENLHVHHGIGVDNVYTVVETGYRMTEDGEWQNGIAPGYTAAVTDTSEETDGDNKSYTVTNSHTPETISVPVAKTWNDNDDQDGIRPESITVELYKNGDATGMTLTLNAAGTNPGALPNWQGSFNGLPKYAGGEKIVYTVKEVVETDGYTASYDGTTVTNTHDPAKSNLHVKKVWNDAENQDGKRPYAVVITLYANGKPAGELLKDYPGLQYQESLTLTATSDPETSWKGTWAGVPRFHNGQRISYTVVETGYIQKEGDEITAGIPVGYTVSHSYQAVDDNGDAYAEVTNSYTPELTDLNVQKVWDDDDNRAGLRPNSITVTLTKQNSEGEWVHVKDSDGKDITAELNPANEWDHTFIGMPKYANGVEIIYGVEETPLDGTLGYEGAKYDYDRGTRIATITNTRKDEKVSVTVSKTWDDADNQDGKRPGSVTVTLYANGIDAKVSETLDASNNWTATFDDLYKHYKGKDVVYTVEEAEVAGYTPEYDKTTDANGNVTIAVKNIHTPEVITIPVSKVWNDNSDQDGKRPDSITVTLHKETDSGLVAVKDAQGNDMTAELTIDNNWTDAQTFVGLPKYEGGKEIVYTVAEETIEGYKMTAATTESGITVTNTHEPEKTKVTVTKVWNDGNDQDGIRPDSVKVHLLANGEHTGKAVELTEAMGWTYTWDPLDKFAAGREIVYTVYEEITTESALSSENSRAITDYMPSYAHDSKDHNKITITNSYTPATTTIAVLKVWNDGADRDGLRPESIQAELYADGVATGKILTLSEANDWTDAWTGVAKYRDQGQKIVYSVAEVSVPTGYEAKVVQDTEIQAGIFIITNSHTPATTGVGVKKVWNDENDNDGKRPDGIIVQLYANGSAVEDARVELNVLNNWSHVWYNSNGQPLYVFDKGEEVSYYVDEVGYVIDGEEYENLPEGYTKTSSTKDYSTSITNTRETEKIDISVEKIWKDSDNNDGIRPATVSITLYRNGEALETVELNADNTWTHTWTKLYKYVAGVEAEYTVKETEVAGYTTDYVSVERNDGGIHWAVTNTHEIETKDVTVSKVWKDNNDAEEYRPDSVKVQLYKNGKAYGDVITLSAKNDWKFPLTLPAYENGTEIVWTIAETKIPKYYSATYNQKTLTVTNTIQSKEIPKTGDDSNLMLWTGMMLLSCAGAATVLMSDRKRRSGKSK